MRIIGRGGSNGTPSSSTRTTRSTVAPAPAAAASARARASATACAARALEPGAIADVEADPRNRGRATGRRGVDDGADAIDVVEPHLDRVAREKLRNGLLAVRVVVLGRRSYPVVRIASFGTPACSIFCSTAVIAAAFCFCASAETRRARLGGNRHERTIRPGRDDGLPPRDDGWLRQR
jgi:hypothetical protein